MNPVFALYLEEFHYPGTFDRYALAENEHFKKTLRDERLLQDKVRQQLETWKVKYATGAFLAVLRRLPHAEPGDISVNDLTPKQRQLAIAFYRLLHYARVLDPNTDVEAVFYEMLTKVTVV